MQCCLPGFMVPSRHTSNRNGSNSNGVCRPCLNSGYGPWLQSYSSSISRELSRYYQLLPYNCCSR